MKRTLFAPLAALMALCSANLALAAPVYAPGQQGTAGVVVTGTNLDGSTSRFVLTGAMLTDSSGAEKATASNPLIVQQATGSSGQVVGSVASGAADSGNPVKVGCVFNTTLPTLTNGQRGDCQAGTRGAIVVQIVDGNGTVAGQIGTPADAATISGLGTRSQGMVFNGASYDRQRSVGGSIGSAGTGVTAMEAAGAPFSHITTNATTTVKSGAGILHRICINTKGATANTATIFDSTTGSGTVIAVLDTTSGVGCSVYDVAFATGLTIVTAAGTAGDLTVTYR